METPSDAQTLFLEDHSKVHQAGEDSAELHDLRNWIGSSLQNHIQWEETIVDHEEDIASRLFVPRNDARIEDGCHSAIQVYPKITTQCVGPSRKETILSLIHI